MDPLEPPDDPNPEAMTIKDVLSAPCIFCGYQGAGYWQRGTHKDGCPWENVGGSYGRAYRFLDEVVGMYDVIADKLGGHLTP